MSKITIKPLPNSRSFQKVAPIVDYYRVGTAEDGTEVKEALGTPDDERIPGTLRGFRPHYHGKLGMFKILTDGKQWTQEDLDKFVAANQIGYPDWHPKKGDTITKSNIRDIDDLYLNSRLFVRLAESGFLSLDTDSPLESGLMAMYMGDPEMGTLTTEGYRAGTERYGVSNPSKEEDDVNKRMEGKLYAFELFQAMADDAERMTQILWLFNVEPSDSTSAKVLRTELFKYVEDSGTMNSGRSHQQLFKEYATYAPDVLKFKSTVARAFNLYVITERGGVYEFAGTPIGSTYEGVLGFFKAPANSAQFDELKIRIDEEAKRG